MLSPALSSAVTGLRQFQYSMDNIGNNIANANTDGYKATRISFADTFSRTIQGGSAESGLIQMGTGVTTKAITTSHSLDGTPTSTGNDLDLMVNGVGHFMVKDANGKSFATRDGGFQINKTTHKLTNAQGFNVQGATLVPDGAGGTTATEGDIDLGILDDKTTIQIDTDGTINVHLLNGTTEKRGRILLNSFQNPQMLERVGGNLYSNVEAAGGLAVLGAPGTSTLGEVKSGVKEGSNVELTNEFVNMITAQRGFQANARVITTSDQMLEEVVNLKR